MSIAATVIVPTYDHGPTLRLSLASALAQTVEDIEIFVIGDGAPDVTQAILAELTHRDERVRFFDHPKGPRHGEIYRHEALEHARGEIVCYLSDDDLWLPEHVAMLQELLDGADFAAAMAVHLTAEGELRSWQPFDLAMSSFRRRMLAGKNFVPLSCGAHTLEAYRRLPQGWSTTPAGVSTDLFMWQKLLQLPEIRARSATRPTALHLPSSHRRGWTPEERVAELERWAPRVADPTWRTEFLGEVLDQMVRHGAETNAAFAAVYGTRTWRLREWLLGAPVLGTVAKALARRGPSIR